MADWQFSSIRDGLKTRLVTITGLRAYDTVPDNPSVPCAIVGGIESIDYDATMARGIDRMVIPVTILASRAGDARVGQDRLDSYLRKTGVSSVKAAVEGDRTLGGAVDTCWVRRALNYGELVFDDVSYLGVQFLVEVAA